MHKVATATATSCVSGCKIGTGGEVCCLLVVIVPAQIQKRTILKKGGLLLAKPFVSLAF